MRILVAGVAGFIGSHVGQRLLEDGHSVVGVDNFSAGRPDAVPDGVEFIEGDLANPDIYGTLPRDIDVILHIAGHASGSHSHNIPLEDLMQNTGTTINLIKFGIEVEAKRLVLASSTTVYGDQNENGIVREDMPVDPLTCYANAKCAAEGYLKIFQDRLPFVIFRMPNVYGPGQYHPETPPRGMVAVFLGRALEGDQIQVMGSVDRFRDFIEVGDVADAWSRAVMTDRADGQTMNLGTGRKTYIGKLLETIQEIVPGSEWFVEGSTPGDQLGVYPDISKIKKYLDFEAKVTLHQGLTRFADNGRSLLSADT
jgi:UDP-glucose 4-epimerase